MNIGLTGSRGFIGSYLLRYLAAAGLGTIRILLRKPLVATPIAGVEVIWGDLRSQEDCERFAENLDVIFHLAHCNSPVSSDVDPASDALLNMLPLINLIQAVRSLKSKPHVVYFSSGGSVYGRSPERIPFKESDLCLPISSYGIQKLAAEHYLRIAAERDKLTCAVLRISNAYGTLLPHRRMQGLIGVAVNNALHRLPVRIFGNPNNVRDYIHLDDICAVARMIIRPEEPFSIFNIGSGTGHSVAEIISLIQTCVEDQIQFETLDDTDIGRSLTDWVILDVSQAQRTLGWSPRVGLRAGIQNLIRDQRKSRCSIGVAVGL